MANFNYSDSVRNVVSNAKSFARTPEGQIVTAGLANAAVTAIGSLLVSKFLPGRTSFGRSVTGGIINTLTMTTIGAFFTRQQRQARQEAENRNEVLQDQIIDLENQLQNLKNQLANHEITEAQLRAEARRLYDQLCEIEKKAA